MNGWVKLHRKTFDNPVCCKDAEHFFVWCWIISNAAYEERRILFNGQDTILKVGELVTTSKQISKELNVNESKVNRILKKLESEKQIERRTSNRNTLIYVVNWEKYQSDEKQFDKQMKNERKTNEKQMENDWKTDGEQSENKRQSTEEQMTINRRTNDNQMTTIKEYKESKEDREDKELKKERKEENNIIIAQPDEQFCLDVFGNEQKAKRETYREIMERIIPEYNISGLLLESVNDWIAYKRERNFTYKERGLKTLLSQIEENSRKHGDEAVAKVIAESIASGYQGIVFDKICRSKPRGDADILGEWRNA